MATALGEEQGPVEKLGRQRCTLSRLTSPAGFGGTGREREEKLAPA